MERRSDQAEPRTAGLDRVRPALETPRLSRRAVLKGLVAAAGSAAIAACTPTRPSDRSLAPPPAPSLPPAIDWDEWWAGQERTGTVMFANWPYYIDRRKGNRHPSLEAFTDVTGIEVGYSRPIRGNARFLERIRPYLEAGDAPPWDIVVVTNGPELSTLMSSGWLIPLDHTRLPNFERHASPLVRDPAWDPGNRYTVAWQSGFTGLGFRPEAVEALGYPPRSVRDLWNPRLQGRIGMMTDLLDLGSAGLLALGIDPATSSEDDWRRAADHLRRQRSTVAPRYYDQGYLEALARGDTWLSLAWSGDIFQMNQLGHPELRFVMPEEGTLFWTDSMMIPAGARNPVDAMELIDFVYRPRIAALIADWVWYVTPVPASRPVIARKLGNRAVAQSPLVFPPVRELTGEERGDLDTRVLDYYVFDGPDDYERWRSIFEPTIYS
jgi:spermidine/putrescine transport system substrate-binding protein